MATETLRLTQAGIANIIPPARGHTYYRDVDHRYLQLRVTAAGSLSYYLIRKVRGKTHFVRLGTFPDMTVTEARQACDTGSADLLKGKETVRREAADKMTFAELFSKYLEGHAKPHKRTWPEDVRQFDLYLKPWHSKPAKSIDREAVHTLHGRMGKRRGHYMANRTLALIKTAYNYGIDHCGLEANPAIRIKHFQETSCTRWLSGPELKKLFDVLDAESTLQPWPDFVRLALLTGARRANVEAMKWADMDLDGQVWTVPAAESKNKEELLILLTDAAAAILTRRKDDAEDGPYVFPSRGKTGHITEPKRAWGDIRDRAGLDGVKIHDLRRTLGSWLAKTGSSLLTIGTVLGHKQQSVTAIYARLADTDTREALERATAAMIEVATD